MAGTLRSVPTWPDRVPEWRRRLAENERLSDAGRSNGDLTTENVIPRHPAAQGLGTGAARHRGAIVAPVGQPGRTMSLGGFPG